VSLSAGSHEMFFIPDGFAHGFLTVSEEAEVEYFCSEVYSPQHEQGIIFSDPALSIPWPVNTPVVSKKDGLYPDLKSADNNFIYEK
jgi:dTDP-4-dehydrorhamnose 3,5-epimerase